MPRIGAKTIAKIWNFLCERRGWDTGQAHYRRGAGWMPFCDVRMVTCTNENRPHRHLENSYGHAIILN